LTEIPGAVTPRLRIYAALESQIVARLIDRPIDEVFELATGQLLILGEPGTGKTNLLLELAGCLIQDACLNEATPIPVVFNLPRWTMVRGKDSRYRPLSEWLRDDLVAEYGLARASADALVSRDRILPLLDGLDEVSVDSREKCVEAINAFQKGRDLGQLVVCCRTNEYKGGPSLDLGTAVRVEKLTRADIESQIAEQPRLEHVRLALKNDPRLWEIVDTPLWLHVLFGAAQVDPSNTVANADPRDKLYARFIEYALSREADGSPRKLTPREPLLRWLGWLAAMMQRSSQSQFDLVDLRPDWMGTMSTRRKGGVDLMIAKLVLGLIAVLFGGVGVGLGIRLSGGPALGMSVGMVLGLVGVLDSVLVGGVLLGLGVALVDWLDCGFQIRSVTDQSATSRSIRRSMQGGLAIALPAGIMTLFGYGVSRFYIHGASNGLEVFLAFMYVGIFVTIPLALLNGGQVAFRHYITRFFLWRLQVAPLRYERFLNEATERLFLIRHGGSYEFLHITFRNYMARAHGPEQGSN
jgi:hypothetical protein